MPLELRVSLGFCLAAAAVYAATPLAIRLAGRLDFYDLPAGYKGHRSPTPYLGGTAVMAGFLVSVAVLAGHWSRTWPLLVGMAILWVIGTIDDRRTVSPAMRVVLEATLAAGLWSLGLGWDLGLGGGLDLVITIAWVLAVVNAFNLFDNMDGAAGTMAMVASVAVLVLGLIQSDVWLAVAGAALAGACAGFLPHNLARPARIFLGDGGSMPVGFGIAATVMIGAAESAHAGQSVVLGLLLVGVPALDTALVVISRWRRGVGVLTGGQDHLTHRTSRWLATARGVAMGLGAIQALVSAMALVAVRNRTGAIVLVVVLYLVIAAIAIVVLEAVHVGAPAAGATDEAAGSRRRAGTQRPGWTGPLLLLFGAAVGASPFLAGFYDERRWIPAGLVLLSIITAVVIARFPKVSRLQVTAVAGVAGIGFWSLLSSTWAPSAVQAVTEANRWFVLAALLAAAVTLVRSERQAQILAAGLGLGVGAVAVSVVARLLGGDPGALFIAGRLNSPLGYVNAEGTTFIMGFWLLFALTTGRSVLAAALGASGATAMASLVLLSQSRGAALALLASLVLVCAVVGGGRLRRVLGLVVVAGAVFIIHGPLLTIYDGARAHGVTPSVGHAAGLAIVVAALAAGLIWGLAVLLHRRVLADRPSELLARRVALLALSAAAVITLIVTLGSAGRIREYASTQWSAFVSLSAPSTTASASQTHLLSGAGNRYDYWRVAWNSFLDHPFAGEGAGNFDRPYFLHRRTTEDVRQPHSIELEALGNLGIVGGALLALLVVALALGLRRVRRPGGLPETGLAVAQVGAVSAWLVHTSVDWIHLIPGVTGIALLLAASLLRGSGRQRPGFSRRRGVVPAMSALLSVALVVAVASLSRQGLSDVFYDRASAALPAHPHLALREARHALRLVSDDPRTHYLEAAALARLHDAGGARGALLAALADEPDNFVSWTLLGDLDVRLHDFAAAGRDYRRALALNPRDQGLRVLARDPRSALSGGT